MPFGTRRKNPETTCPTLGAGASPLCWIGIWTSAPALAAARIDPANAGSNKEFAAAVGGLSDKAVRKLAGWTKSS